MTCRAMWTCGLVLALVGVMPAAEPAEGVLPVGKDGKPLNLDFETGTLKDWTAEGEAFAGQPVKGDTVHPRRSDMRSRHQGQYWVGTYERKGDRPQGTLTSVPFKVTHPWASFLVGGGPHPTTCVELVRKDTGEVFHRASITKGELSVDGRNIDLRAIEQIGLATIEGEDDDISAVGQTGAAHALCSAVPERMRRRLVVRGSGHFSLFHGRIARETVAPAILELIGHVQSLKRSALGAPRVQHSS